jgi:hypothetical protein
MFPGTLHAVQPEADGDLYNRVNLPLHPTSPLLRHVMIGIDPDPKPTDLGELRTLQIG